VIKTEIKWEVTYSGYYRHDIHEERDVHGSAGR